MDLGPLGMQPWGEPGAPSAPLNIYPDYAQLAALLEQSGVPPDFESDAHLRTIHRRDGDTDLYFVANPASTRVVAQCTFRTSGRAPELWDPRTGRRVPQCIYRVSGERTTLPLQLEPSGSIFVVFRGAGKSAPIVSIMRDGADALGSSGCKLRGDVLLAGAPGEYEVTDAAGYTHRTEVGDLPAVHVTGPWRVEFQPGRKAPARETFDSLIDWTSSTNPGIRYFSGLATYHTTFDLPRGVIQRDRRIELDLGRVRVMARVKLNGKDLGILWKTPYRVDATGALKTGMNELDIEVANLWPNRMIGDASLPEDQRVTWAAWNPFKPDWPLVSSGLLGPVELHTMAVIPLEK